MISRKASSGNPSFKKSNLSILTATTSFAPPLLHRTACDTMPNCPFPSSPKASYADILCIGRVGRSTSSSPEKTITGASTSADIGPLDADETMSRARADLGCQTLREAATEPTETCCRDRTGCSDVCGRGIRGKEVRFRFSLPREERPPRAFQLFPRPRPGNSGPEAGVKVFPLLVSFSEMICNSVVSQALKCPCATNSRARSRRAARFTVACSSVMV